MIGSRDKQCFLTLVDRKTGYLLIGKLKQRSVGEANRRTIALLRSMSRRPLTLTPDNGTEFHG